MNNNEPDRLIGNGHAFEDKGDFAAALQCYQLAADQAPHYDRAHMNVGNALRRLKRWEDALVAYRTAVQYSPHNSHARFNLALLLVDLSDIDSAERELVEAIRLQPDLLDAHLVLADVYETQGRHGDVQSSFDSALAIAPHHAGALLNYGAYWARQGLMADAKRYLQSAYAADPHAAEVHSFNLFSLNFRLDLTNEEIAAEHFRVGAEIQRDAGSPFTNWNNSAQPDRPLRVAYLSGDFSNHPITLFLRPVLENHDRTAFRIFCYSNYPHDNEFAGVLRRAATDWREISSLDDMQLCDLLREDEVDIAVDLSGHTSRNRLSALARHPVPVQVTWLGYLNTTGLPAMDYRICDYYTDPPGTTEHLNVERLVRLQNSQWCYLPWYDLPSIAAVPRREEPSIIFGSFNQYAKISDHCLRLWCGILNRLPRSRLLVLDVRHPSARAELVGRFESNGIDATRISIRGRQSILDYFSTIGEVDIALDTFPYNGATTTFDALWMGVPLVALRGQRALSRGSFSILSALGASDLIARNETEYTDINVALATDRDWRLSLRNTLRLRLSKSPLMHAKRFVTDLEICYRAMWQNWCEGRS